MTAILGGAHPTVSGPVSTAYFTLLNQQWLSGDNHIKKEAARKLIALLRSTPVPATALQFGARPADTSGAIKTSDAANSFARGAPYGLSRELPPRRSRPTVRWSRHAAEGVAQRRCQVS